MNEKTLVKPRVSTKTKTARPPLYKVILLNDDFTPREFVVQVLKAVFRMGAGRAEAVMLTAHRKGSCVIAVYTRDVAETKAKRPPNSASRKVTRCFSRRNPRSSAKARLYSGCDFARCPVRVHPAFSLFGGRGDSVAGFRQWHSVHLRSRVYSRLRRSIPHSRNPTTTRRATIVFRARHHLEPRRRLQAMKTA